MPEIPWTQKQRQERRRDDFIYNHSLSDRKQNLLGYIMPSSEEDAVRGRYNVMVPELGNELLQRITKADPAGNVAANGSGVAAPPLRVGQPVLVDFMGNKTQPFISQSFPLGGDEEDELGIDKKSSDGRSAIYQPPQNSISRMFNGWGNISPVILRDQSKVQPDESAAQVEVPGSYDIFTDDGKRYRFNLSNDFDLTTDFTSGVEGKRGSSINRPRAAAQKQSERIPYEINNALERFYSIAQGEFLPEDIREGEIGDAYKELFDPILERLENLEAFYNTAEEFVEEQVEWYEEYIKERGERIFELWKDVINKDDIISAFGLEQTSIQIGIMPLLDRYVFSQIPRTGNPLVDAAISYGISKLKSYIVDEVLSDISLGSLEIGGIVEIGLSVFGGGGASLEKYSPADGTIINITPPRILSEGGAVYETIKYGRKISASLKQKSQQIGSLTSSIESLIEGLEVDSSSIYRRANRNQRRSESQQKLPKLYEFEVNTNFNTSSVSILGYDLSDVDDLILIEQQKSISGEVEVNKDESGGDNFTIISEDDVSTPRQVKAIVNNLDQEAPKINDDKEFRLLDTRNEVRVIPRLSYDGTNVFSESAVITTPHTKTYESFALNIITNSSDVVLESSIYQDFSTLYQTKESHRLVKSDANKEVLGQTLDFHPDYDYIYVRPIIGDLVFPTKEVKKPYKDRNVLNYDQEYEVTTEVKSNPFRVEGTTSKSPDARVKSLLVELIVYDQGSEVTRSDLIEVQAGSNFSYEFDVPYKDSYDVQVQSFNKYSGEWKEQSNTTHPSASFGSTNASIEPGSKTTIFEFSLQEPNEGLPSEVTVEVLIENSNGDTFKDFEHYNTRGRNEFNEAVLIPQTLPSDLYSYRLTMKSIEGNVETSWKELDLT